MSAFLRFIGKTTILFVATALFGTATIVGSVAAFNAITGTRIGHEVPEILLTKVEELLVKTAEAKASTIEGVLLVTETKLASNVPEPKVHVVKKGEWLSKIAARNGVTVAALVKANKGTYPSLVKNPSLVHPGWKFSIPLTAAHAATTHSSSPEKSVLKKQNVYPEQTAKAAPQDKHRALSKEGTPTRITKKEHRGASRHPEQVLRLKLSSKLPRVDAIVQAYSPIVEEASRKYRVPKHFIYGLIYHESGGDTNIIGDKGKSRGLMQLYDPTRVRLRLSKEEAHDPEKAIPAGTKYLREQYDSFGGNPIAAISAYNAPKLTKVMLRRGADLSSRDYVRSVKAAVELFKRHEERLTSM